MTARASSTSTALAWSMFGNTRMVAPCRDRSRRFGSPMRLASAWFDLTGTTTRTSTPRRTAIARARMRGSSGKSTASRNPDASRRSKDGREQRVVNRIARGVGAARNDGHRLPPAPRRGSARQTLARRDFRIGSKMASSAPTAAPNTSAERIAPPRRFGDGPMYSVARFIPPTIALSPSKRLFLVISQFVLPANGDARAA